MIKREIIADRRQIVSEYLTGGDSFQTLSVKYGVNARTILGWVRSYRKRQPENVPAKPATSEPGIKELRKQLAHSELKNELLEEMLRLAEEQSGIDFRKKFGFGQ